MRRGTVSGEPGIAFFLVARFFVVVVILSLVVALARGRTHLAAPGLRYLFARDATFSLSSFLFFSFAGICAFLLLKVKCLCVNPRSERARQIVQKTPTR
jgi:hypothetical protein